MIWPADTLVLMQTLGERCYLVVIPLRGTVDSMRRVGGELSEHLETFLQISLVPHAIYISPYTLH